MITVNTEKGLVRVETWADIEARPRFTASLDPSTTKLDKIIGGYALTPFQPCGLSTCHTRHGKGYLVSTVDSRETNIGKDCGKRYFDVDFKRLAKAYDREQRNSERRDTLTALQHRVSAIEERMADLMEGATGAKWISRQVKYLIDPAKGLPSAVVAIVSDLVRRRNGALTKTRQASASELDLMRARGQPVQPGPNYVTEPAGQLEGVAALYKENDLRKLLVTDMENLSVVKAIDVEGLKEKMLRDLAKWSESIDSTLKKAEDAIASGSRLLKQDNLRQLLPLLSSKEDQRALQAFIAELAGNQAPAT